MVIFIISIALWNAALVEHSIYNGRITERATAPEDDTFARGLSDGGRLARIRRQVRMRRRQGAVLSLQS